MEVDQAQALGELGLPELLDGKEDFRGVEPELGVVAGGQRPFALAAGQQLRPQADHGLHAGLGGDADDPVEFGQLLDDDDDLFA